VDVGGGSTSEEMVKNCIGARKYTSQGELSAKKEANTT
jgi:hypothetical protein